MYPSPYRRGRRRIAELHAAWIGGSQVSALEEAKAALNVAEAWHRLGLPGQPSISCRSPFREDRSPSFSVYEDGHRFKDHSTGQTGDVADFVAEALRVSLSDAARWLLDQAGSRTAARAWPRIRTVAQAKPTSPEPRKPLALPKMDKGTIAELAQLRRQRGFEHFGGLQILLDRAQLRFATMADGAEQVRCWIITDASRRNAQARRLDGLSWQSLRGTPKAKTLPGSQAAWPIGASRIEKSDTVLFTEGTPDLLAAATFATFDFKGYWEAVAMIGAGLSIHTNALPLFAGKTVFLFVHHDSAGIAAARRWHGQLTKAGATVTALCSETEGRDLCDAITAGETISIN